MLGFLMSLFRLALIVGVIVGGLYFFFRDSELFAYVFPDRAPILAGDPPGRIAVKTLIVIKKKNLGKSILNHEVVAAYEKALERKFNAMAQEEIIPRARFLELEKAAAVAHLLKREDTDGDGFISRQESRLSDFQFAGADDNNDGKIDGGEYWRTVGRPRVQWFQEADKNRNGSLSREEFFAAYAGGAQALAEELDLNSNKALDRGELNNAAFLYETGTEKI